MWRLQRGDSAECRFFQQFADNAHFRQPGGTRQGIYLCTPSGRLLTSDNSHNADEVCRKMRLALEAWDTLPETERHVPAEFAAQTERRWEDSCPRDGLILESVNRELADERLPASERSERWNRDHVWFSRDEARRWLPPEPQVGVVYEVPPNLTRRLTRFHLVDNVRGQTVPFAASDVAGSQIEVRVLSRRGSTVEVSISGNTQAVSGAANAKSDVWHAEPQNPRGIATRLLGRATFDLDAGTFSQFELVALGQRWGHSNNNGRGPNSKPSPIGFVFRLAPAGAAQSVPPAFVDVYDAGWIERP